MTSFLLVLAGVALLASGTWRQSAILFGRTPPARVRHALIGGGYTLLAASLAIVLAGDDPSRAVVGWFGELTVAAIVLLVACWWRQRARARRGR